MVLGEYAGCAQTPESYVPISYYKNQHKIDQRP